MYKLYLAVFFFYAQPGGRMALFSMLCCHTLCSFLCYALFSMLCCHIILRTVDDGYILYEIRSSKRHTKPKYVKIKIKSKFSNNKVKKLFFRSKQKWPYL